MRTFLAAQAAAVACAAACGGTLSYEWVPADGGASGTSGSSGAGGGADPDDASSTGPGDAAGYVRDLGPQSAAIQINASHTASTDDPSLFGSVARRWDKAFPGLVSFPLIAHGKVIVTYATADRRGALQAFDSLTGASVWGPIDLGPSEVSSSAYDGGRVFALTRKGTLRAFDVDSGSLEWTTELGNPATPMQFLAAPTAYGGKVYILPNNFGAAVAVHEVTGAIAWTAATWGGYASPAVTDVAVYVALNCETAYRLGLATGTVIWHSSGTCNFGAQSPVVYGDKLLVASEVGGTTAHDLATGVFDNTRMGGAQPAVHDGILFLTLDDFVYARTYPSKPSGNIDWNTRDRNDPGFIRTSPMVAGGHVHVLWSDCAFRVFDELTGDLVWTDSEPAGCIGLPGSSAGPVSIAAAAGVIAVPYGTHLVAYGVTPVPDAGVDAPLD